MTQIIDLYSLILVHTVKVRIRQFLKILIYGNDFKIKLNIPAQKFLPGTETLKCPHIIVGDEAFGLSHHVLRPYGGKNLTKKKRIFNYRLSRTRRYIECTFGILANKWRIFHRPINVNTDFAEDIIKACCILHNFVRERDGYNFEHTLTDELNSLQQQENVQGGIAANTIRDHFSTYFESDIGAVPWQDSKI